MTRISSPPALALPQQAWDTHAHVFGPFDRFPLAADCRYQPPDAPAEAHRAMLDTAGFAHGVLVHPSANGYDNFDKIAFWRTPVSQCGAGECVPYYRWVSDYVGVIGGR